MKSQRKICAATKSHVKTFVNSNVSLNTSCTRHPGNGKYCSEHVVLNHPSVHGSKIVQENCRILRSEKTKTTHFSEQDFTDRYQPSFLVCCLFYLFSSVFDVEAIHGFSDGKYLVKWEGYEQMTYKPPDHLPKWITDLYNDQNNTVFKIPAPKIIGTEIIGSIQHHHLSWDPNVPAKLFPRSSFGIQTVPIPAAPPGQECNTQKDPRQMSFPSTVRGQHLII